MSADIPTKLLLEHLEKRELPSPRIGDPGSFEYVLSHRRSRTDFDAVPLSDAETQPAVLGRAG